MSVLSTGWTRPARTVLALGAVSVAAATAQGLATVAGPTFDTRLPGLYVLSAILAVFVPRAILVQVVLGQAMLAAVLSGPDTGSWVVFSAALGGVVLTAELLGVAARMAGAVARDTAADVRRVVGATAVAVFVLGSVLLTTRLPGPDGLVGILVAAVALVGVALALVGDARGLRPSRR